MGDFGSFSRGESEVGGNLLGAGEEERRGRGRREEEGAGRGGEEDVGVEEVSCLEGPVTSPSRDLSEGY